MWLLTIRRGIYFLGFVCCMADFGFIAGRKRITSMINRSGIWIGIAISGLVTGCGGGNKTPRETPTSGTINISVDESFQPIIDSEIKVFESSFPNAHIIPHYKPEAACFRDLAADSARMIIVTRGLTLQEDSFFLQGPAHYEPTSELLAYDAIAVIVNNQSKDSIFDIKDLRAMLNGEDKQHLPVLDGLSATSTVRYAIDSILRGQPMGKNV